MAVTTTPEIVPFVSAVSVMLSAYGFFYTVSKPVIDAAEDVPEAPANRTDWDRDMKTLGRARTAARTLTVVPILVWILLLEQIEGQLASAVDDGFAPSGYSTLDVLGFVLANAWLAIALVVGKQWFSVRDKRGKVEGNKPDEPEELA